MPTTYTSLIGLALPTTGELTGTWGTVVNDYITRYLDAAIAGTQTLSTDADVTLTVTNGSNLGATSAQYAILNCTGARTVQRTITVPAASKSYLVINGTTGGQSIKVVGSGPTTGVTLANGERALIAWNGSDFVKVGTNFAAGGSNTQVQFNSSGALAGSANMTFNGTTLTVADFADTALTAGRVTYAGVGGNLTDSANLTFNGTTLTANALSLTNSLTVANGGTGLTSGTSGGIPFFSSTSAMTSSGVLAANALMIGGGAGVAPSTTTTGTGILTFLGTPSSANLANAVTDETGSGSLVFGTSPTLSGATLNGTTTFGGSVTPASNTVDSVGYTGMPQNSQSAAYTLVAADAGKTIVHPITDNNARTFTIPANGTVAYPVGTTITFVNMINTVTISITTDTMYLAGAGTTGSRTLAAYGVATAIKVTSTSWIISGNGLT